MRSTVRLARVVVLVALAVPALAALPACSGGGPGGTAPPAPPAPEAAAPDAAAALPPVEVDGRLTDAGHRFGAWGPAGPGRMRATVTAGREPIETHDLNGHGVDVRFYGPDGARLAGGMLRVPGRLVPGDAGELLI